MKHFYTLLIVWNIICFLLMGIDKYKASHNLWRIPERVLLGSAFFLGGAGIILGGMFFHHKTRKLKFQILEPLALIFNAITIYALFYYGLL